MQLRRSRERIIIIHENLDNDLKIVICIGKG